MDGFDAILLRSLVLSALTTLHGTVGAANDVDVLTFAVHPDADATDTVAILRVSAE